MYPTADQSLAVEHLTTFLPPSSTYRSLSIPLPETAKPGERWRLGLFPDSESSTSASRAQVALARDLLDYTAEGPSVLSVWSEGIEITRPQPAVAGLGPVRGVGSDTNANTNAKGKKATKDDGKSKSKGKGKEKDEGPKQGRILREWSLDGGATMTIVEQTSFDLDKVRTDSNRCIPDEAWEGC